MTLKEFYIKRDSTLYENFEDLLDEISDEITYNDPNYDLEKYILNKINFYSQEIIDAQSFSEKQGYIGDLNNWELFGEEVL